MKIITLFLLFTLCILADDIRAEQFQPIIENGWNENNKTLNQYIIKQGAKVLPKTLNQVDMPIIEKKDIENMPKILLSRNDYLLMFSYMKYLESKGDTDKSIEIYLRSLKGLSNIKRYSFLSVFYKNIIEKIIIDSLNQTIKTQNITPQQLIKIKEYANKYLIKDDKIIFDTFEHELDISDNFFKKNLKSCKTNEEKANLIKIAKIYRTLTMDMYLQCDNIKSDKEDDFIKTFNNQKNKFLDENADEIAKFMLLTWDCIGSQYVNFWKDKKKLKEKKEFLETMINTYDLREAKPNNEIGAKLLFFISSSPKYFFMIKKDTKEQIERNEIFIKNLERCNNP